MTTGPALVRNRPPNSPAVLFIIRGLIGAHLGISYQADDVGTRKLLHLAWHQSLRDEESTNPPWVEPELSPLDLSLIRTSSSLIARRKAEGRVPYGFDPQNALYNLNGILELNGSLGLTCVTFVQLVLAHAGVKLIDESTWDQRTPTRLEEDEGAQKALVNAMRSDWRNEEHAALLQKEIGATRVRPEELAAASGLPGHPVGYPDAESAGRALLGQL